MINAQIFQSGRMVESGLEIGLFIKTELDVIPAIGTFFSFTYTDKHLTKVSGRIEDIEHVVNQYYFQGKNLDKPKTVIRIYLEKEPDGFPSSRTSFAINDLPLGMTYSKK